MFRFLENKKKLRLVVTSHRRMSYVCCRAVLFLSRGLPSRYFSSSFYLFFADYGNWILLHYSKSREFLFSSSSFLLLLLWWRVCVIDNDDLDLLTHDAVAAAALDVSAVSGSSRGADVQEAQTSFEADLFVCVCALRLCVLLEPSHTQLAALLGSLLIGNYRANTAAFFFLFAEATSR